MRSHISHTGLCQPLTGQHRPCINHHLRPQQLSGVACNSYNASSTAQRSSPCTTVHNPTLAPSLTFPPANEQLADRAEELRALMQEASRLAVATGPRGVLRAVQGTQALLSVAQQAATDVAAGRPPPTPPVLLRSLFERLGATYIKLGQFVASSPTLFPAEYVEEFQKCLDATDPVAWPEIQQRIATELGGQARVDEIFSFVNPVPLASASIAQVHAAVLRSSGQDVVIKVLKPGVEDVLIADLNFLYLSARLLEFINPELSRTSLAAIVGDIRTSMLDEVDFTKEAAHVQQFSNYLDAAGLRGVATCPFVYKQFSTTRVLTMERLNGVALTDLDAIRSTTRANPEQTLINALNTWFGSLLGCETFHADVHAGNLLVLPDGRVGFIDFGIVGRISPAVWGAMESLLIATSTADYNLMARALLTMGATSERVDLDAFSADLQRLFDGLRELDSELVVTAGQGGVTAGVVLDDAQVNRLLLDLVRVADVHGIRFPREFGLLLKQLLYFDRYTKILAPELQVLQDQRINLGSARL